MKKLSGKKKGGITIDGLAVMVAHGFGRVDERFEKVDEKFDLVNKKIDLGRNELKGDISGLKNDIDVMLSRHIGTFRKDYDDLAARVKKLEEILLKR